MCINVCFTFFACCSSSLFLLDIIPGSSLYAICMQKLISKTSNRSDLAFHDLPVVPHKVAAKVSKIGNL